MKIEEEDSKKENLCKACGQERVVAQGFGALCYSKWKKGNLRGDWPPYTRKMPFRPRKPATQAEQPKETENQIQTRNIIEVKTGAAKDGDLVVALDFGEHAFILDTVMNLAREEIRTVEEQCLYLLRKVLIAQGSTKEARP